MAWTYDTSLATSKDHVRLLIGDVLTDIQLLSDEEINAVLTDQSNSIYSAVVVLCRSLSARFGREASIYTDVVRDEKTKQAEHFASLADKYSTSLGSMSEVAYLGGVDSSGNDTDPFFVRDLQIEDTDVRRELNNQ